MRKGQTQTVFIFILITIMIGLMFILAYKGITTVMDKSDDVAMQRFISDIRSDVNSVKRMQGTSREFSYSLPSEIFELCFVRSCNSDCDDAYNETLPSINSYKDDSPQKNLFLIDRNDYVMKAEDLGIIVINNDSLCIKRKSGQITVRFEGLGDRTRITK